MLLLVELILTHCYNALLLPLKNDMKETLLTDWLFENLVISQIIAKSIVKTFNLKTGKTVSL